VLPLRGEDAEGMDENTTPAIAVRGLTKRFGAHTAVDGVAFDALAGRVTALLGPNGAGKTTTIRTLLGLVAPDAGSALIHGQSYSGLPHPGRSIGAVLDGGGLHPGRSGRDHLRIVASQIGVPRDRADAVLDEVGLTSAARRHVSGYSLGMRQRTALAAALLGAPDVLVLDEPANGLDPEGMHWLREYIRAFADGGGTVLLSSHVLSEIELVADDLVVIAQGHVVATGDMASLVATHGGNLERFYLDVTATQAGVR
jgi:ABC-2 type transport system ATP-binding protein